MMLSSEHSGETTTKNPLTARGQLILVAAQNLFLKHGFDETSLEMIIADAGGSRRSIYQEFGNKQGLLMAVMQQQVAIQVDTIASINYELEPSDALKDVTGRFVQGMLSETLISLFRLVIQVVPKHPDVGELIYDRGPLTGVTPLADYLSSLNKLGILAIDDCSYAAQMLIEMTKGRLHLKAVLIPNVNITEDEIVQHIDRAVDLFIKAYQP
ncbi:TetR/AcrR family transcriptional regulator [Thalassotalea sp. ND16A]|uniref:TetR/AcrR family transcriptional regulator n=1 Tax=Thalassotalea sp. ND16A TaxID=1535422 RepID=UPI00051DA3CA|nr:TetR/AcrR family transcriptional regulator [Thalassotalea sp. ND16A]KGJ88128.1 putative transcriptional regulator, TetR family [Thalassotalea sp. ND16A]